jgi:DHA1 family multidrug resistance protein-like MFS transporter
MKAHNSRRIGHDQTDTEKGRLSTEDSLSLARTNSVDDDGGKDVLYVDLSGKDDPLDPKNWPLATRLRTTTIIMLLVMTQAWAGASEALSNEQARTEFGISATAEELSLAMYLFGVGSGSLFYGPLSNTIGRTPTYLISTFAYLFFVLGSALTPTFAGQLVCRFLVGLCCSATLSINGASVKDQFGPVEIAFVFPCVAWANVAGESLFTCYHSQSQVHSC